jgi:hypothetical protein
VWYNNYGKKERYITMMKKTLVETNRRTKETYKVTGMVTDHTDAELIDFCDINNFGGYVIRYGDYVAYVTVYID